MSLTLLMAAAAAPIPGKHFSEEQTRLMMASFADCVVGNAPRKATKLVLGGPFRIEDENFGITMRDCIPPAGTFKVMWLMTPKISLRLGLADALLRREPSLGLPPLQLVPPLDHDVQVINRSGKARAVEVAVSRLGECIVRAASVAATALVRSKVGTPAEAAAFAAIKPASSSCLTAGQTFTFSPDVLRGTVALNYYRLAKAAPKRLEATK